jgi:hypothetical protein
LRCDALQRTDRPRGLRHGTAGGQAGCDHKGTGRA